MNLADPVEVSQYMNSRKLKKKTCLHTASKGNIKTNLKHSDYELIVSVSEDSWITNIFGKWLDSWYRSSW